MTRCCWKVNLNLASRTKYAFSGCGSIEKIVIPDTVVIIQKGAFKSCTSLEDITLPISVSMSTSRRYNDDDYDCFNGDRNVKKVRFTKGTGVGINYVFSRYSDNDYSSTPWYYSRGNEIEVEVDEGVTSVGDYIFKGCTGLKRISLPSTLGYVTIRGIGKYSGTRKIRYID